MVGFRFLLDSGLHVADAVTEAPLAAARDPHYTSESVLSLQTGPGPVV
jgi:hypothetical protein